MPRLSSFNDYRRGGFAATDQHVLVIWDDGIECRYATPIICSTYLKHNEEGYAQLVRQAVLQECALGNIPDDQVSDLLQASGGSPFLIAAVDIGTTKILAGEAFGFFEPKPEPEEAT